MDEPSPRSSRLALAGALAAALVVGGAGFLLGRASIQPAPVAPPPSPPSAPAPAPPPPVPGVLGRSDLLALAAAAADAEAGGGKSRPAIAAADGRRFELRLPFGCDGPAGEGGTGKMRWHYDEKAEALRVHVAPLSWTAREWFPSDGGRHVEAVEGFWLTRPWTSSETCPAGGDRSIPIGVDPVTLPGQTLALGQIFRSGSARRGRRDGEAYEAVIRVAEKNLDVSQGLRVRLTGRIARAGDAGPVLCRQPAGPDQRPICLIAVELDEVAIENPATGRTLATWNAAGDAAGP